MISRCHLPPETSGEDYQPRAGFVGEDLPLNAGNAATYIRVSVQMAYLWAERRQTPQLRVMGRFFKSALRPFSFFQRNFRSKSQDSALQSFALKECGYARCAA